MVTASHNPVEVQFLHRDMDGFVCMHYLILL